jgi:hypothetical protein
MEGYANLLYNGFTTLPKTTLASAKDFRIGISRAKDTRFVFG